MGILSKKCSNWLFHKAKEKRVFSRKGWEIKQKLPSDDIYYESLFFKICSCSRAMFVLCLSFFSILLCCSHLIFISGDFTSCLCVLEPVLMAPPLLVSLWMDSDCKKKWRLFLTTIPWPHERANDMSLFQCCRPKDLWDGIITFQKGWSSGSYAKRAM